jgi:hypothetical protein
VAFALAGAFLDARTFRVAARRAVEARREVLARRLGSVDEGEEAELLERRAGVRFAMWTPAK